MFEGLFSAWHLLIIGIVVLLVVGPRRLVQRWRDVGHGIETFLDGKARPGGELARPQRPGQPPSLAYRVGRRLRRRR